MATSSQTLSSSDQTLDPLTGQPKKASTASAAPGSMLTGLMSGGAATAAPTPTPQDAAAAGLGWVDKNHPLWGTPGYVGSTPETGGTAVGDPQQLHNPTDGLPPTDTNTTAVGDPPQLHNPTDGLAPADTGGSTAAGGWPTSLPPDQAPANPAAPPTDAVGDPPRHSVTDGLAPTDTVIPPHNPVDGLGPNDPPFTPTDPTKPGTPTVPIAPVTTPTVPTTPPRSAEMDALVKQLQARAAQSTVVDGTDPNVRHQADAFSAQQERSRRQYLADQAEGNSPYSTGAQAGLERMTAEKAGQASGQFESELINRELTSRRTEIQQALESMGGILSDEEKNGLQRELSNLNASIETAKTNTQNNQFFAGLNQEDRQFLAQMTQQDRFKGMDDTYRRMELAQNQSQFISKLAQDGKIAEMDDAFKKAQLSQQDSQFLKNLAQQGKFAEMEDAFKKMSLSQDQNQFVAKLAQEGRLAEMDDLFRRMKLMQEQSQFLDRLGFDTTQQQNYWDWMSRGNASPPAPSGP